jgi:hypothetical protein
MMFPPSKKGGYQDNRPRSERKLVLRVNLRALDSTVAHGLALTGLPVYVASSRLGSIDSFAPAHSAVRPARLSRSIPIGSISYGFDRSRISGRGLWIFFRGFANTLRCYFAREQYQLTDFANLLLE